MRNFNHSVGVLVKAYFDGTLEHGNCAACAVGNLVADGLGTNEFRTVTPMELHVGHISHGEGWPAVFCTVDKGNQLQLPSRYFGSAKAQIDSTGYSWGELAKIEAAFEAHNREYKRVKNNDTARFNGLMAVVDVLADIHGIDLTAKEEAKKLFTRDSSVRELQQKELSVN